MNEPPAADASDTVYAHCVPATPSRKLWWRRHLLVTTVVVVVLILALVGGIVGGMLSRNHTPEPTQTSTPSLPPTPSSPTGTEQPQFGYAYPTAVPRGPFNFDVFGREQTNHSLWYKYYNSLTGWQQGYTNLGGTLRINSTVAAISLSETNMNVFAIGTDSQPWYRWQNGESDWGSWFNLRTGIMGSDLDGVAITPSRIDLFDINIANKLVTLVWVAEAGWGLWTSFADATGGPGQYHFMPTPISWGLNRGDVFVVDRDTNKVIWNSWSSEGVLSGAIYQPIEGSYCTSRVAAVSWGVGRIDIFCRGGDAALWHASYSGTTDNSGTGNWSSWDLVGSKIVGEPHAVAYSHGQIDVFVQTVNNTAAVARYDEAFDKQWRWTELGGSLAGPPKAVLYGGQKVSIVAYNRFGHLVHRWRWEVSNASWGPSGDAWEDFGIP